MPNEPTRPKPGKDHLYRILGFEKQKVLVANSDGRLTDFYKSPSYNDQAFFLESTGKDNQYWIISYQYGTAIYSKSDGVGLEDKNEYNEEYFALDAVEGRYEGYYRLTNKVSDTVLTDANDKWLWNFEAGGRNYADQYFAFIPYQTE